MRTGPESIALNLLSPVVSPPADANPAPAPTAAAPAICRFGLPLAPGRLQDLTRLALLDAGKPVPLVAEPLAHWPDGSLRLLGLRFALTTPPPHPFTLWLDVDPDRGIQLDPTALPQPPADTYPAWVMQLPADYLCRTRAFGGPLLPAQPAAVGQTASAGADPSQTLAATLADRLGLDLDQALWKPIAANRVPTNYRVGLHSYMYYDVPQGAYTEYVRTGDPRLFTAGYVIARVYREKMIVHEGPHRGQAGDAQATTYSDEVKMNGRWAAYWKANTADELIPWNGLRTLYIEGLLADWHLTADPRSFAVAREIADAYVQDIPKQGLFLRINERNPGWPLVELTSFYAVTQEAKYLDTARLIVDDLARWQAPTGGWLREYEDEQECPHRCVGGQPFMHAILLQGLIRYYELTGDEKVRVMLLKGVDWLLTDQAGWRPSLGGWVYLPGCKSYQGSQKISVDLSALISHPLAWAWRATGQERYHTAALAALTTGLREDRLQTGKLFAQRYRTGGYSLAYLQGAPVGAPDAPAPAAAPTPRP